MFGIYNCFIKSAPILFLSADADASMTNKLSDNKKNRILGFIMIPFTPFACFCLKHAFRVRQVNSQAELTVSQVFFITFMRRRESKKKKSKHDNLHN